MNKICFGKLPVRLLVILLIISASSAIGQGYYNTTNWRFSNPKQFGFSVSDIDFFDNNKGVAVGAYGGIAYTTDGGNKWSYGAFTFMSPAGILTSTTFQDVHFVSANVVYAVGTNGCMAKSTDGGVNWSFVPNPLFPKSRNINTVWFLDENKGYMGGQWNANDSIPRIYTTLDGGMTWDSLNAPIGGKTKVGYVNNPNLAPLVWDITSKAKEIYRIQFINNTTGYVTGSSASGGGNYFPPMPAANASTCLPTGGNTSTSAGDASLVWKISNGTVTDYSISKERLGYNGIYNAAPNCSYRYANNTIHTNNFKAMNIINDSTLLIISFNNNIVIRINTGVNDSTANINVPGVYEKGKYTLLNATNPPVNNSNAAGAPIPANPVFAFSNPLQILKAPGGKLMVPVLSPTFGPVNRMFTSVDNGTSWVEERILPTGRNYSDYGGQAIDLLPSGRFVYAGQNGVVADSIPGGRWSSSYVQYGIGSYNKVDFADCNNGIAAGSAFIIRTKDGGKTWDEIIRSDFANLNIFINSVAYVPNNPSKAYFTTSTGTIYKSNDINAVAPAPAPTIDPVFSIAGHQMWDVATVGPESVWACGYISSPAASTNSKVFRSTNGGVSWTIVNSFSTGSTSQLFRHIEFPSRLVGYVTGTRDTVWKTTDGGLTWNKLPVPTPGVTPQITYTDMYALDVNTVFLVGNGFPRKVVFRTTDGGNTWQEITGNILSIMPVSNLNSVVFHDINNGYVGANGAILVTNNGGASWRLDVQPSNTNNVSLSFSPKAVPAGTPFAARRMFTIGAFGNHIMEYGDTTLLNVYSSEAIVSSCTSVANGSISITASGGIPPYSYSLNGGAFQSSNVFNNITPGVKTIIVKDAACGSITKSITIPSRPSPVVNAGPDRTIVDGDAITLYGSGQGNPATIAWTPATSIVSAGNTYTPVVKPLVTTTYVMNVVDVNGCTSSDNALVTVIPYCVKVMNAFTPNGDGINDKWLVTNGAPCMEQITVAVYNRYGNEVYQNDNYNNNWDGTYKGKPVPDGTYYYVIKFRLINGQMPVLKGDVTILR